MKKKTIKLTSKEQKIFNSIMINFPATSKECAIDHAIQGGTRFQFIFK